MSLTGVAPRHLAQREAAASVSALHARGAAPVLAAWPMAIAGMAGLLLMTRWGIGTSPDSVHYIRAARDMLAGEPVTLTQFAPLYALLLAAGGLSGLDPLVGARWLNTAAFGLNIILVGFIIRRSTRNLAWSWAIGSTLMLGAVPVLSVHAVALSEPVFLLLFILGFCLLGTYLDTARPAFLLGASGAMGLALLARYAGAACILAGAAAIVLLSQTSAVRRIRDTVVFGVLGALPMLIWMGRNLTTVDTATNREFAIHPIGLSHVWQALYTASGWMLVPASAPDIVRFAVWGTLAACLTLVLRHQRKSRLSMPTVVPVLALFIVTYAGFLVASISFLDANTPLDNRILLPVFVAGLIVALCLLDAVWPALGTRPVSSRTILTAIAVFVAGHITLGAGTVFAAYANGWGFSSVAWQQSPTLARLRSLPGGTVIYSNAPEIIYLHTGRTARSVPKTRLLMTQRPNEHFDAQMAEAKQQIEAGCGVVVYFRGLVGQKSVPPESQVIALLSLQTRSTDSDGSILGPRACRR